MSFGRPAARLDWTTALREATGTSTPETTMTTWSCAKGGVAVGETGRSEAQVERPVPRQQRKGGHLAKQPRVRVEWDASGLTLHPKACVDRSERFAQPLEVPISRRRADVDVDGRVAGVVKARRDTTDDDELHLVIEQRLADRGDPLVVDLGFFRHGC